MEETRALYTKEELADRVKVPAMVEQDLKQIISDRLEQCGIYFRVYSRIKTSASMAQKFQRKEYGGDRKLQDLIGIRVNLYFDDDVEICKTILENTFVALDWSTSEITDAEFKPTKLNGVFHLPEYLKKEISSDTWKMGIDDTFEIQIKTMFFEGWHEIEHDMRYKGEDLWGDYKDFSRYFNSILATLELCDKSMITLFEDLGHALYKSGRWADMIKSHFRLKMGTGGLYPEVEELLNKDISKVDNLGKRIYKTRKIVLVEQLLKKNRRIPINANTIVAILNDNIFHDSRLSAIFKEKDVYNDGREESVGESRHYELRPLRRHTVFQMCAQVDGSRIKDGEKKDPQTIFERASNYIYQWTIEKYRGIFTDMPQQPSTFHADVLAYHVAVNYDAKACKMSMHVRHMDLEVGGRIWYSEAGLEKDDGEKVILKLSNGYAEPDKNNQVVEETSGKLFSYPGYYKLIVDNLGLYNGLKCHNRRRLVREDHFDEIITAINDKTRIFPIVLITSNRTPEGLLDEDWLEQFRVSDFTKAVWRYSHVLTCNNEVGTKLLQSMGKEFLSEESAPRLFIFWPGDEIDVYGPENVRNCSFGRHLEARGDARTYDIVRGGQAFYHKIMTELRDWNVSAYMWEGFKLEIMTEILK